MTAHSAPVHRSVRTGGILIVTGVIEFVVAMIVAQLYYPNYSLAANYVSDLGNTAMSPHYWVFNLAIIAFGLLAFAGTVLAWSAFPSGTGRIVGLGLLLIASVGAIGVGLSPENVNLGVHDVASLLVFLPGGVALVVVGASMTPANGWGSFREFSIVLGAVMLIALAVYLFTPLGSSNSGYAGLVERVIVAPVLLWGIVVGTHLARLPIRARRHLVPGV